MSMCSAFRSHGRIIFTSLSCLLTSAIYHICDQIPKLPATFTNSMGRILSIDDMKTGGHVTHFLSISHLLPEILDGQTFLQSCRKGTATIQSLVNILSLHL